ncbi:hypothetical protein B0A49_05220, partial [Cryomyces minteri]
IVFATPLYFGLAHFHHLYEFRITHPSTPWAPAILRSLFQFTYTSLFGFFASFLYLRTGSVWACVLTHAFCNYLGIPRLWGRVGQEVGEAVGEGGLGREGEGEGPAQEVNEVMRVGDGRLGVEWTVAYYTVLVAGAVGFYYLLWPLTESRNALVVL